MVANNIGNRDINRVKQSCWQTDTQNRSTGSIKLQPFYLDWEDPMSSGNKGRCCGVCSYCKWLLKNWHSHLVNTSHLSQTNEDPALQSEIDISLWTSYRIFWILREVHSSLGIVVADSPPQLRRRGERDCPCRSFMFINIHSFIVNHGSWNSSKYCWMDGPGIHFVAVRMSEIELRN